MNRSLAALAAALLGLVVLGCAGSAGAPSRQPPQPPSASATPPPGSGAPSAVPGLSIQNGTALEVSLVVNGVVVRTIGPGGCLGCGGGAGIPAVELPALPWNVAVLTPSRRELTTLTVHEGDVAETSSPGGGGGSRGVAARVDLSCGRLDVWAGPPIAGPAPGPGSPGDCAP